MATKTKATRGGKKLRKSTKLNVVKPLTKLPGASGIPVDPAKF